jgi:peptidoglycan/xylan/chitin deacetylase (PgdA/CDA1 family)
MIADQTRRTAKAGLHAAGWYRHQASRTVFPGVLVLCYHGLRSRNWRAHERAFPDLHVAPETFEGHCRVLRDLCHPIDAGEWREAARRNAALPSRPVLVTFDDGYRSVFDLARPILKKYEIPAAIFVSTQAVADRRLFWYDEAARGAPVDDVQDDPLCPMLPEEVSALAREGFEIGVHTVSHPVLAAQSADEQRRELSLCRQTLAEWTGRPAYALAYPFGKPHTDYSPETVRIAGDLGFEFGFTTQPGFAVPDEPPLERSRFLVLAEVSPSELAHRIVHSWHQPS